LAASGARIAPKQERGIVFGFNLAQDVAPGRWVIPVEVTYSGRSLGQFREAIVEVVTG
jgi:hypothetical protein